MNDMSIENRPPRRELTVSDIAEQSMDESIEVAVDPEEIKGERRKLFEAMRLIFSGQDEAGFEILDNTKVFIKDDEFRITDFIGRGSWGLVLEVELVNQPNKKFALKISAPFNLADQFVDPQDMGLEKRDRVDQVRATIREVEALKRISSYSEHSPYPQYQDAQFVRNPDNSNENILQLLMEKIEGENLEGLITEGLYSAPEVLLNVAKQFAEAIALTHRAGFVHRDIKPGNALIDENDCVRLVDLGMAVRTDRNNSAKVSYRQPVEGLMRGTDGYMYDNEDDQLTPEHDVYTLGRTFQHLLVGDAFQRSMDLNTAVRKLREPVVRQFADLSYRMIRTEPNERPTMPQVLAELDRLESQLQQDEVRAQIQA